MTLARQFSGGTGSGTYQDSTAIYDGHGRVVSSHRPEQRDSEDDPVSTTYTYYDDDKIETMTDARGAVTSYQYNNRSLPSLISYSVPSPSDIGDPETITFDYDALGNPTLMEDGLGEVTYEYDELSRMTAETREFDDYSPTTHKLEYTYALSGLKSYEDPFGLVVNYTHDKIGRLLSVSGTGSSGTTTYASNADYRAWGALEHLDYGNGTEMNAGGFNNRNQTTTFEIKKNTTQIIDKEYQFYADGSVKKEDDNVDAKLDRSYQYDHLTRMVEARSGVEASGGSGSASNIPYRNSYTYDAFGHQTGNDLKHFTREEEIDQAFVNNRTDPAGPGQYDVDGRMIWSSDFTAKTYEYDAAGDQAGTTYVNYDGVEPVEQKEFFTYAGTRLLGKIRTSSQTGTDTPVIGNTYFVRSTVLGGEVITDLGDSNKTYIRANGTVIAETQPGTGAAPVWKHKDPNFKTFRGTAANGSEIGGLVGELNTDGQNTGLSDPYTVGVPAPDPGFYDPSQSFGALINGQWTTFWVNGIQVNRSHMDRMVDQAFHGALGLMETRIFGYGVPSKDGEIPFASEKQARDFAQQIGRSLINRYWQVSDNSWVFALGLIGGDPDEPSEAEMEAALQALAGPSAGPNGGDIDWSVLEDFILRQLNVNCITNSVENGRLGTNNIKTLDDDPRYVKHDGIHVQAPVGTTSPVVAVPAMRGTLTQLRLQGAGRTTILISCLTNR